MKKENSRFILILLTGISLFNIGNAGEYQKLAQTGFQFLTVVSDARAVAMGEAMTSLQIGSSALFFNPAGMSQMETFFHISASNAEWIADIKHYTFSAAIKPYQGDYGVLGFSLQYVDYGNFIGTRVNKDPLNLKGYDDVGIFSLYAYAFGVGYAKQLTDRFNVGGQIRWAYQDLGKSVIPNESPSLPVYDSLGTTILYYADSSRISSDELMPVVFDFGTQFSTGYKSLVFGMSVRNFSKEMQYVYEGFQTPLVFTLGISMNLMDLFEKLPFEQSLIMCIDASHHRDHPEQLKVGIDYKMLNTISLRSGYITNNDESGWSFGVGISKYGFEFDYAYTPFGVFNTVQRFTARFSR